MGHSTDSNIPCWEFENAHSVGENQRDTLVTCCISRDRLHAYRVLREMIGKKFRMLYHWLLLVALSKNLQETDKLGLKCSQKTKKEKYTALLRKTFSFFFFFSFFWLHPVARGILVP